MQHLASNVTIEVDSFDNRYSITFTGQGARELIPDYEDCKDGEVDFSFEKHTDHRSKRANRLLWACIGDICTRTGAGKWETYLGLLRDYGKWKHMELEPDAAEYLTQTVRETEVIGIHDDGDRVLVELFAYYGSSTYNTTEFSRLVEGVKQEMKNLGLALPANEEWEAALKYWRPDKT